MEDYCKDNRRNARNQAKNDHFKGGKNKARRHKDTVVENERNSTQEAEISHLGFKIRNALKEQTLKIIYDQREPDNDGNIPENVHPDYIFGDSYIKETKLFLQKNEIKLHIPAPIHDDGPNVEFPIQTLISFIMDIDEKDIDKWVILNFAHPTKPGGGFEKDASVYEESLVLSSCLYRALNDGEGKSMYEKNKQLEESEETDNGVYRSDLIYSPNVPFFRDEEFDMIEDWKSNYQNISIISIPAVNYNKYSKSDDFNKDEYEKIMRNRINRIYRAALKNGHTKIVLGPWGCGLDGGPLKNVIKWFSEDELSDLFDEIYFLCDDEETSKIMEENF